MTVSIGIERGFYGLTLALDPHSSEVIVTRRPRSATTVDGFSISRAIGSTRCGEIAKTTFEDFDLVETTAYRLFSYSPLFVSRPLLRLRR